MILNWKLDSRLPLILRVWPLINLQIHINSKRNSNQNPCFQFDVFLKNLYWHTKRLYTWRYLADWAVALSRLSYLLEIKLAFNWTWRRKEKKKSKNANKKKRKKTNLRVYIKTNTMLFTELADWSETWVVYGSNSTSFSNVVDHSIKRKELIWSLQLLSHLFECNF